MSCCNNSLFTGVQDFDSVDFITEINVNLKAFLDKAFLSIGAYVSVDTGTEYCEEDVSVLYNIPLPPNSNRLYSLWATKHKDWVWETITYNSGSPNLPTIYINGVDQSTGCEINYPLGQVKTLLPVTSMTASYSFRKVQVYTPYNSKWWLKLTRQAFDPDNSADLLSLLRSYSVQMPAIALETGPTTSKPLQMGSNASRISQVVIFNIIADSASMRDKLTAIIVSQNHSSFNLFNSDRAEYPLNCDGTRNNSVEYADIPQWKCIRMENNGSSVFESPCGGVYFSRVRMIMEIQSPQKPKIL